MRQKFSVTVADVSMNILCDETQETVDAAVTAIDKQIRTLGETSGHSCTRTEAAILSALDAYTRAGHLADRVRELEAEAAERPDPAETDALTASLAAGENEALRAELAVSRGKLDALLSDNAALFELNAKLSRQSTEANARADRMHDQVLSMLTEVAELRKKLEEAQVETPAPAPELFENEPEPEIEVTPEEQQVMHKYESMDVEDILRSALREFEKEGKEQ